MSPLILYEPQIQHDKTTEILSNCGYGIILAQTQNKHDRQRPWFGWTCAGHSPPTLNRCCLFTKFCVHT